MIPKSVLPAVLALAALAPVGAAEKPLPGTQPLTMSGDLSEQMVAGISKYLDREWARASDERLAKWREHDSSKIEEKRRLLRERLGMSDAPLTSWLEVVKPYGVEAAAENGASRVSRVRWRVYEGVHGEGLLLEPAGKSKAIVIAIPDADQTPEQIAGVAPGVPEESQFARRIAEQGCTVLIPALVDRQVTWSGSEKLGKFTNQPHREWIYRQAFEVGRTLTGYEVQKVLSGLDALGCVDATNVAVAGYGEGGLIALHAAALDSRIDSTLVSGHFGPHPLWKEPLNRNLFRYHRDFGDAELAALIAPRPLVVEHAAAPEFTSPPPAEKGRRVNAAPGEIRTAPLAEVEAEVNRAKDLEAPITFVKSGQAGAGAPGSDAALAALLEPIGITPDWRKQEKPILAGFKESDIQERQRRTVRELEEHTQQILEHSELTRYASDLWKKLKPGPDWAKVQKEAKRVFAEEVIGELPKDFLPANPRSRKILEREKWIGYDVVLDVHPDIFAWGVLLLPKDLQPGERRPVVVCQHGLEGLPMDTITDDQSLRAFGGYKAYAARLAERGFIVFAPHNPYRGQDAFRTLQRKAQPLGWTLFSVINAQHDVITRWLASLPSVDPDRIGFYGLSYGGKSAMRTPAVIDRYCLSICSGDFNEWVRKNAWIEYPGSYMFTHEYEIYEWDLGHTFNYAEMALLIHPRPFMVERGHKDGVASSEWVGYEFAKVLRGYTQLGLPDHAEIEWFDGPHTINSNGTFKFLHKHLDWPEPK